MVSALVRFVTAVAAIAVAATLAGGVWLGYQAFHARDVELAQKDAQIAAAEAHARELETEVKAQAQQIERLQTAIRLLKVDHRVAYLDVIDQQQAPDSDRLKSTIEFVEVDDAGHPLDLPKQATIDGDLVYIDYWVIKFDDELVEKSDPLRSTSLALFRRLFGEFQEPSQGFALDRPGTRPLAYGKTNDMSSGEQQLWDNFWQYATDPEKAKAAGVRAAHGEAPSTKLVPNKRYKILLRASGGLSITPEERTTVDTQPAT